MCLSSTDRRGLDEGNFLRNSLSGTRLLREVSPGNARGSTVLVLVLIAVLLLLFNLNVRNLKFGVLIQFRFRWERIEFQFF